MSTQEKASLFFAELKRQKDAEIEELKAKLQKAIEEREYLDLGEHAVLQGSPPTVVEKPQPEPILDLEPESTPEPEPVVVEVEVAPEPEPEPESPTPPSPPQEALTRKGRKGKKVIAAKSSKGKSKPEQQVVIRKSRPPIKKTMVEILGDKEMTAPEMMAALMERGYMSQSKDPQMMVSWMFCKNRDAFIRVSRGLYRLNPEYRPAGSTNLSKEEVDSELADMGLGEIRKGVRLENPFQS